MYDRDPALYERDMSSPFMRWLLAGRREEVGEMVRGRLLDIGFGTGLSLPHYPAPVEVVAVDFSLTMLRQASRTATRPVRIVQADAEHLPFRDLSFDSVAFNLCLCTIPDPARAVKEAIRVARAGAPMVFLEHVRSHLLPVALAQELINPAMVWLQADYFNRRTASTVRGAGVEVLRIERWFAGVMNLIVGRAPGAGSGGGGDAHEVPREA